MTSDRGKRKDFIFMVGFQNAGEQEQRQAAQSRRSDGVGMLLVLGLITIAQFS
jgi:hypothetical protein